MISTGAERFSGARGQALFCQLEWQGFEEIIPGDAGFLDLDDVGIF